LIYDHVQWLIQKRFDILIENMLHAIARKHVSPALWRDMLAKSQTRFKYVYSSADESEPHTLVMTWNTRTNQPDGRFVVAFGTKLRCNAHSIRVLWIGTGGEYGWVHLLRQACKVRDQRITSVQLCVRTDQVRDLHRLGFRVVKCRRSGVERSESGTLRSLMRRLPRGRVHGDLPCVTDINSLLFRDQLMKLGLIHEIDEPIQMYLKV